MEEETRELRKLDEKFTRDHEEIQAQLQTNDLYNSLRILQLKQQLSLMKGITVKLYFSIIMIKIEIAIYNMSLVIICKDHFMLYI